MQRLAQFLAATGRRLRNLGFKLAVKISFFIEIEAIERGPLRWPNHYRVELLMRSAC